MPNRAIGLISTNHVRHVWTHNPMSWSTQSKLCTHSVYTFNVSLMLPHSFPLSILPPPWSTDRLTVLSSDEFPAGTFITVSDDFHHPQIQNKVKGISWRLSVSSYHATVGSFPLIAQKFGHRENLEHGGWRMRTMPDSGEFCSRDPGSHNSS